MNQLLLKALKIRLSPVRSIERSFDIYAYICDQCYHLVRWEPNQDKPNCYRCGGDSSCHEQRKAVTRTWLHVDA